LVAEPLNTKHYDFIFAGGGLAGLSLAYSLARSPLRDRSMLIVDRDAKQRNDRTWCFWTAQPTPFDGIVHREWNRIRVASEEFDLDIGIGAYRYKLIRGIDFYRFVRQELSTHANVEFLQGNVEGIADGADGAQVSVDGRVYAGRWAFDSRFSLSQFNPDPARYHYLQQHFRGWEIETPEDRFDPAVATLMDFRTPQENAMCFFYVLPFSKRAALVEYVTLSRGSYDAALKAYVENVLNVRDYRVVAVEGGISPLSDYTFPRRTREHVMTLGTNAGRIKPSTGYAFMRIQQDSTAIVQSLVNTGHPFDVPSDPRRYRVYDSLMLELMQRHGDQFKPIFTALFKNNPIARVFRFLDEEAPPAENALLIASLPPRLFLQALFRMKTRRTDEHTSNGNRYRRGDRRYCRGSPPRAQRLSGDRAR
jgi:lycopene beta-cyclase